MSDSSGTLDGALSNTPPTATMPQIPHHPLIPDIAKGLVLGDFAGQLGPAGAVTQIVVNFIPGIGTLAALRDLVADIRKPEPLGILLNSLSVVPVLGGLTKTAEVLNNVSFAGESFVCLHGLRERAAFKDGEMHAIPKNRIARTSVLAAFFAPLVAVILAVLAVLPWQHPILGLVTLWGVFVLPVVAILAGHAGAVRAKRIQRATPGLMIEPGIVMARAGAALGWLAVFLLLLVTPDVAAITTYVVQLGTPMFP
jgi:hypothetical protein